MLGLLLTLIVFPGSARALEPSMSGISFHQYPNFYKKWNQVTTRFREDTKELRFVYANDLAFAALKAGTKYPDGAMFAKIGMSTKEDEAFASSVMPSVTSRYQFMVRDEKKFADTGGWGYALFTPEGRLFPGDPKLQVKACAACHAAVPSRQFVFSELAPFDGRRSVIARKIDATSFTFRTLAVSDLPKKNQDKVPAQFASVRLLQGGISADSFVGTLDEVRILLAKEAIRSGLPSVFMPKKQDVFLSISPEEGEAKCAFSDGVAKRFRLRLTHDFELCSDKARHGPDQSAVK